MSVMLAETKDVGEACGDPDFAGFAATLEVVEAEAELEEEVEDEVEEDTITGLLGLALASPALTFAMAATHCVTWPLCSRK